MKRFKTVFRRPNTSDTPDIASSRRIWRRNTVKPRPETTTTETTESAETEVGSSSAQPKPATSTVSPVGDDNGDEVPDNTDTNTNHPTDATSGVSRSKFGTKRLKQLAACFRSSNSDGPITQPSQPEETGDAEGPREQPAGGPLSSNPFEEPRSPTDTRNVSGRTSHSRQSSQSDDTVNRYPPDTVPHLPEDRLRMSLDEDVPDWMWPGLMYIPEEGTRKYSDPFSDSKSSEYRQPVPDPRPPPPPPPSDPTPGPSRRPHRSPESSRASEGPLQPIPEVESIDVADQIQPADEIASIDTVLAEAGSAETVLQQEPAHRIRRPRSGAFSAGSDYSVSSAQTQDPTSAITNFNHMAAQHGINVRIAYEATPSPQTLSPTSEKETETETERTGRHLVFGRLRSVRSNIEIPQESQERTPKPKLRRIKTIASIFVSTPANPLTPMTSLNGRTIEELSRFGGHSYIVAKELGPCPLELPAFMVTGFMFLHRDGLGHADIFLEPGDMETAIRLYDGWAEQVFEGEKLQEEMDLTTRVVAMPPLGNKGKGKEVSVLSVGWALKAVLAGLANGILGSVRLYQTLQSLFAITIPERTGFKIPSHIKGVSSTVAIRVQLISLALLGLASEKQRDLICTTFGLLTYLLHPPRQSQPLTSRTDLRWPTTPPDQQKLACAFAPLLLGPANRPRVRPGNETVEMELEEQRVATLLLDHWPNVHRQMQVWSQEVFVP
ncbi:hypothetical protein MYU51_000397 [Penicillium brevicompactum]|uniref:uncharacterized protein n=1 Tax=Penicillium brevicompactum TaxID=5074 RepID=UPI0025402987|nr:uncharacterized protein N7506_008705 [Penicillium brevicompactum]KAJ5325603.1 hypothetical protein N7506_008705 [Penicillium brevicompactum]